MLVKLLLNSKECFISIPADFNNLQLVATTIYQDILEVIPQIVS